MKKQIKLSRHKKRTSRKNPLVDISILEYFNVPTLTDFNKSDVTISEYFNLGLTIGYIYGLKLKKDEDTKNDINAFYQREISNYSGSMKNKTKKDVFEVGVLFGLKNGIDFIGRNDKTELMKAQQKALSALGNHNLMLTELKTPKIATPYD